MARKRTFIKVRSGLLEPKHRRKMGSAVWLYLYILDRVNWDDGILHEWIDESVAYELDMSVSTVRYQRRKLEDEGYIQSRQHQYYLSITVTNYDNPAGQGDKSLTPSKIQGDKQGDNQGDNQGDQNLTPLHIDSDLQTNRLTDKSVPRAPEITEIIPDEIIDYEAVTGFKPYRAQWNVIIPAMQYIQRKDRVAYLRQYFTEMVSRGHNPNALFWLTEWARDGTIPTTRKGKEAKVVDEQASRYQYIHGKYGNVGEY